MEKAGRFMVCLWFAGPDESNGYVTRENPLPLSAQAPCLVKRTHIRQPLVMRDPV